MYNVGVHKGGTPMLKAVFFDLDGTLLPMDEGEFTKVYFKLLYEKIKNHGYNDMNELVKVIWTGTKAMMENDGTKTNEEVFWNVFVSHYGERVYEDKEFFDEFYRNEFSMSKMACGENKYAKQIVDHAKKKVDLVILSTNPIFPKEGALNRMGFVNLKEEDFDFITYYENSSYCKPNPQYFTWLLNKYNLKPNEVIVFGNNDYEDYACAKKAGLDCYLIGDTLILHEDMNISCPIIKMEDVCALIDKEYEKRL